MSASPAAPPARRGRKIVFVVVCLLCVAAGGAVPMVVDVPTMLGKGKEEGKGKADAKTAIVPFGELVVNLNEERHNRYLRLKLAVLVEADAEKDVTERMTKQKAAVKSKLIGHLAGKTLKDVSGQVGVTRLQREVLDKFEDVLYPEGGGHLKAVLFEEYVIQ